jgi:hypothetical protein
LFRLVVGHVDNVVLYRRNLYRAFVLRNELVIITLEIAGRIRLIPELLNGGNYIGLLSNYRLTETPGPVEILIQEFDNLGVIEQGNDGIVPVLVRLKCRVVLEILQEPGSFDHLQRVRRRRQYDSQQIIGIKCDRADEFFDLCG